MWGGIHYRTNRAVRLPADAIPSSSVALRSAGGAGRPANRLGFPPAGQVKKHVLIDVICACGGVLTNALTGWGGYLRAAAARSTVRTVAIGDESSPDNLHSYDLSKWHTY